MTISTTTNKVQYNCDGVTKDFDFTFPITTETDIVVILINSVGAETTFDYITDYTVSTAPWDSGGTITTTADDAWASGYQILIKRLMTLVQSTDYVSNDPFPAETHEAALDRLVMISQQLDEENDRAIKLPQSSAYADLELPDPEAEKILAWNSAEDGLKNISIESITSGLVTTTFTEGLLDDPDADTFWATFMADLPTIATIRSDLDVPSNAEAILDTLLTTKGDIMQASAANTPARLAIGNPGQAPVVNAAGDQLEYWTPSTYIAGLELANNATDANYDIDIAVGEATDSTDAYVMKLTSAMTKQLDATWAAGTNQGGLFSGTIAATTWYHVFLIRKDSDGSIDAGFDTSVSAANIPTGYTAYRRIGSVYTDATPYIIAFHQYGDEFWWDSTQQDYTASSVAATAFAQAFSVPSGVNVLGHFAAVGKSSTTSGVFYSLLPGNTTETTTSSYNQVVANTDTNSGNGRDNVGNVDLVTDTSSQIYIVASGVNGSHTLWVGTRGWKDPRGKAL